MQTGKQLSLPNVSNAFMKTADVLLVLDDGVAISCHSQILCLHSAVLRNMLADLAANQQTKGVLSIPLADFTEAQCSALLTFLYGNGVSGNGTLFDFSTPTDHSAAAAVARFAHKNDAPHALQQCEAHLMSLMQIWNVESEELPRVPGWLNDHNVLDLAVMADNSTCTSFAALASEA